MARSKLRRRIPFILAGFWLIVLTWATYSMQATGFDLNMLESNESVSVVETGESIHFSPAGDNWQRVLSASTLGWLLVCY